MNRIAKWGRQLSVYAASLRTSQRGPEPIYAVVRVTGDGSVDPELHMNPVSSDPTGALSVSVGIIYSHLGSALEDILINGLPTRKNPAPDGSWIAVRNIKNGSVFEAHPAESSARETGTEEVQYIAECEYTCGFSFGPGSWADVNRKATEHEPDCYYGGPVIRKTTDPAPPWVNDPLLDPNSRIFDPKWNAHE